MQIRLTSVYNAFSFLFFALKFWYAIWWFKCISCKIFHVFDVIFFIYRRNVCILFNEIASLMYSAADKCKNTVPKQFT